MQNTKILKTSLANVYSLYITKATKKGGTKEELWEIFS